MKPYKEEERKKLESKLIFAAAEKKMHPREKKNSPRIGKSRKKKKSKIRTKKEW
jgi:hypothetical protein